MQQLADLGIAAEEPETGWICWLGCFMCVGSSKFFWRFLEVMKLFFGFFLLRFLGGFEIRDFLEFGIRIFFPWDLGQRFGSSFLGLANVFCPTSKRSANQCPDIDERVGTLECHRTFGSWLHGALMLAQAGTKPL